MTKARSLTGRLKNLDGSQPNFANRSVHSWPLGHRPLSVFASSASSFSVLKPLSWKTSVTWSSNSPPMSSLPSSSSGLATPSHSGALRCSGPGTPCSRAHLSLESVAIKLLGVLALLPGTGTCQMQELRMRAYSSAEMQQISHNMGLPSSPGGYGGRQTFEFSICSTLALHKCGQSYSWMISSFGWPPAPIWDRLVCFSGRSKAVMVALRPAPQSHPLR